MRIYKLSMRFRVPALDQSDYSICYNYDLRTGMPTEQCHFSYRFNQHNSEMLHNTDNKAPPLDRDAQSLTVEKFESCGTYQKVSCTVC